MSTSNIDKIHYKGNVGIGTADPACELDVEGDVKVSKSVDATHIKTNKLEANKGKVDLIEVGKIDVEQLKVSGKDVNLDTHSLLPVGCIVMWHGETVPNGWQICDGTNDTPDLRDRFVVGAGKNYSSGDVGGAASVTLSTAQMPSHNHGCSSTGNHTHSIKYQKSKSYSSSYGAPYGFILNGDSGHSTTSNNINSSGNHSHTINSSGGNQPHENRPPYYALYYIMKVR